MIRGAGRNTEPGAASLNHASVGDRNGLPHAAWGRLPSRRSSGTELKRTTPGLHLMRHRPCKTRGGTAAGRRIGRGGRHGERLRPEQTGRQGEAEAEGPAEARAKSPFLIELRTQRIPALSQPCTFDAITFPGRFPFLVWVKLL